MSDFGLFEADLDAQQAPQRQQRHAANKLASAIYDVRDQYGPFLMGSTGKDEFEDRWHHAKNDIRKTIEAAGAFPNTGVMRRVHNAMKREFVATLGDDNAEDPTKKPKNDRDGDTRTITDKQYKKVKDGDPSVKDEVKTNTGDGSDASGNDPSPTTGKQSDPRDTDKYRGKESARRLLAEDFEGDLVPEGNFEGYLDSVDQGGPEKVQRLFTDGDDSGSEREARRIAVDLYKDFAASNGLRVASRNTLEHYADTGIDNSTYMLLANLIHQASDDDDCDCDDSEDSDSDSSDDTDTDGPQGPDTDNDGPPSGAAAKGGEESSDDEDDTDSERDDAPESDGGSDDDSENPFGGGDDSDAPEEDSDAPSDDAGSAGDPEAPPGPPMLGPEDGGDPAGVEAPPGPPDLSEAPPLAQDDFSGVHEYAPDAAAGLPPDTELVPVEQIEDALGLPPGTLEQILMESEGHGAPPPQHMGRRLVSFGEGADPAAGGQAVAPAAPASAEAASGPDNGALLDQAAQAVTVLVDQKTQEYQTIIDPLQQALQAIDFAQQVEQAANPLDVTPPEGTVDVSPQSAVDPAAAAAQQTAAPPAAPAAPAQAPAPAGGGETGESEQKQARRIALRRHAYKLAQHYGLSEEGYKAVLAAMSRKHYQHVAEAIQTLPPEHRIGIAASLADMFSQDNVRFNSGQFMASAGVPMGADALRLAGNPAGRAGDRWADGRDRGVAEHGAQDIADGQDDYYTGRDGAQYNNSGPAKGTRPGSPAESWKNQQRSGSRHPFVIRSRTRGGGRTAGETWKAPGGGEALDAFEFPGQGEKPEFKDNMKVNDLPKVKGPKIGGVVEDYQRFNKNRTEKGLNHGGEADIEGFIDTHKVGPRAQDKLHQELGLQPHGEVKVGAFQPRVAGWEYDDHLNGYVTHIRQAFHCPCGQSHTPPSHGMCRCGKLWYTYAIGTGQHLASGDEAEMFLAREIPVRENVIMANRQFHAEEGFNNASGEEHWQDYPEDIEFITDDELASAPKNHAPGETDLDNTPGRSAYRQAEIEHHDDDEVDPAFGGWPFEEHKPKRNDGKRSGTRHRTAQCEYCGAEGHDWTVHPEAHREVAQSQREMRSLEEPFGRHVESANYGDDDHNPVERNGEKFCSACDAMLWDPNVHHCPVKQASRSFFADWTVYSDDDNAGYTGPKEPPATTPGKQPPKDWAKRDDKGNWVKPQFK